MTLEELLEQIDQTEVDAQTVADMMQRLKESQEKARECSRAKLPDAAFLALTYDI